MAKNVTSMIDTTAVVLNNYHYATTSAAEILNNNSAAASVTFAIFIGELNGLDNSTGVMHNASNESLQLQPEELFEDDVSTATSVPKRDSLLIVIPLTVLYAMILVTGVLGNLITCLVIARNKHMRTSTNYYLFSLAVSDLLLLVTGLPQEMYLVWSRYPYIFGETFCLLRGLAAEMSANATVLTITAFTVERYIAICHPFLAHTISNTSRSIRYILFIWISALFFAIPQALQFGLVNIGPETTQCTLKAVIISHSFELSTLFFFVIPMTVITVLYTLIAFKLRRSSKLNDQITNSTRSASGRDFSSDRRRVRRPFSPSSRRVLRMLVAVVVAFFICWAPFHIQRLVAIYGMQGPDKPGSPAMMKLYAVVTYVSGILYYVSTTINPILYHTMSNKFRKAFKDTVTNFCCTLEKRGKSYYIVRRLPEQRAHSIHIRMKLMPLESSTTDSGTGASVKISYDQYVPESVAENGPVSTSHTSGMGLDLNQTFEPDENGNRDQRSNSLMQCFTCLKSGTPDVSSPMYFNTKNLIRMHNSKKSDSSIDSNAISNSSLKAIDAEAIKDELFNYQNITDNNNTTPQFEKNFENHVVHVGY